MDDAFGMLKGVAFLPDDSKKARAASAPAARNRARSGRRRRAAPSSAPQRAPILPRAEWNDDPAHLGVSQRSLRDYSRPRSAAAAVPAAQDVSRLTSDPALVRDAIGRSKELQAMLKAEPGLRRLVRNPAALAAALEARNPAKSKAHKL